MLSESASLKQVVPGKNPILSVKLLDDFIINGQ